MPVEVNKPCNKFWSKAFFCAFSDQMGFLVWACSTKEGYSPARIKKRAPLL